MIEWCSWIKFSWEDNLNVVNRSWRDSASLHFKLVYRGVSFFAHILLINSDQTGKDKPSLDLQVRRVVPFTIVLVVAPMAFMMTQQRTRTVWNPKLIAFFARLKNKYTPYQTVEMRNSIISLGRETVQIEIIIVRPNFHVNISEQSTIRECMWPSFKGSVNMDP